jgi:hypothetical protein
MAKVISVVQKETTNQLKKLITERSKTSEPSALEHMIDDITKHILESTKKRRDYLEFLFQAGAEIIEPDNYATLPGKLNHATILALKVSQLPLSGIKKIIEEVDVVVDSPATAAKGKRLQGGGRGRGRGGRGAASPRVVDTPSQSAARSPSPLAVPPQPDTPEGRASAVVGTEFWIWKAIIPISDQTSFSIWDKLAEQQRYGGVGV